MSKIFVLMMSAGLALGLSACGGDGQRIPLQRRIQQRRPPSRFPPTQRMTAPGACI